MPISSDLFEAYLKCPTKCFLRYSVKQEPTIATRIGLGHNTFPTPPMESNNL
jgi:hypothetical protein